MKGIMRKGFFISLTAVLLLVLIIFFLRLGIKGSLDKSQLDAQKLKHKLAADYVSDVKEVYIPAVLGIACKYALNTASQYAAGGGSIAELNASVGSLMYDGTLEGTELQPMEYTLPHLLNRTISTVFFDTEVTSLQLEVVSVRQASPYDIMITTLFNFSIASGELTWNDIAAYETVIDVNGLADPETGRAISRNFWITNSSRDCYLRTLADYDCEGVDGIEPMS